MSPINIKLAQIIQIHKLYTTICKVLTFRNIKIKINFHRVANYLCQVRARARAEPVFSSIFFQFYQKRYQQCTILNVDGCDDEEEIDNDILLSTKSRNSLIEKRELDEDKFALNDTEDDLNEEKKIELESDKERRDLVFLSRCSCLS